METNNTPNPQEPQVPQYQPEAQQQPPQQPVYQAPAPAYQPAPAANNNSNGISIASLVCGILGLVGAWFPIVQYFTFVLSILGIIFGVKGRKTAPQGKTGLATAGMVLGIISVALSLIGIICICALGSAALSAGFAFS